MKNPCRITFILLFLNLIIALKDFAGQSAQQPALSIEIQSSADNFSASATDSLIRNVIDQTNLDTLIHFVNILSGEDSVTINDSTYLLLSRNAVHPHKNLAADFLFQTLSRYGLAAFNHHYSATGRNVYAVQTGTDFPEQKFIICAHYDDMPMQPPAPGAEDNASGTAVVLEAARILSQLSTRYTIIYALWDEEEIGLFGSTYFVQQACQSGEDIIGTLNINSIGWDGNDDGLMEIHTMDVANSIALANLIQFLIGCYQFPLSPVTYNPGTERSDHASFWKQGYSAICLFEAFLSGDFNPYWHTSDDRIKHFNLDYYHAMAKLAVATISHLALSGIPVGVETKEKLLVSGFALHQNYPNPFNAGTTITFELPKSSFVTLKVYNRLGEEVATLIDEQRSAGIHKLNWDIRGFASGVYFYKLETGSFTMSRKMLLIR